MEFGKLTALVCTAAMMSGCVSVGNQGMDALTEEEKAELRQEIDMAAQELRVELDLAMEELQAELREEMAEFQDELTDELLEELLNEEGKRPMRICWHKGMAEGEIENREQFAESLRLEEWKASGESTEELEEKAAYTVELKKSIGLLDGWNKEYNTVVRIAAYGDSNLVSVELDVTDNTAGLRKLMEKLEDMELAEWQITLVYEVPEDVAENMCGLMAG